MCIKVSINISKDTKPLLNQAPSENAELIEYQTAHDFALHSDNIGWQISSIIIAAVILSFSFLVGDSENDDIIFGAIFFINIVLSIWILIFLGQYQKHLMKLYRIREIEKKYQLKQNYYWEIERFGKKQGRYRTYGPSGIFLTKLLFWILVISPIIYGIYQLIEQNNHDGFQIFNLILIVLSFIVPFTAFIIGCCKEKEFKDYISTNP